MFIRSERLFLRPGWPEDGAELGRRIAGRHLGGQFALTPQDWLSESEPGRLPRFLVTLPGAEGARMLGCAGLQQGEREVELVTWIAPEHQGQGFGTEAARAVLRLARTLGHRALAALHPDVASARRLIHKLGFRPTGERLQRRCPERGELVSLFVNRRELGSASDCDGGEGGSLRAA